MAVSASRAISAVTEFLFLVVAIATENYRTENVAIRDHLGNG